MANNDRLCVYKSRLVIFRANYTVTRRVFYAKLRDQVSQMQDMFLKGDKNFAILVRSAKLSSMKVWAPECTKAKLSVVLKLHSTLCHL